MYLKRGAICDCDLGRRLSPVRKLVTEGSNGLRRCRVDPTTASRSPSLIRRKRLREVKVLAPCGGLGGGTPPRIFSLQRGKKALYCSLDNKTRGEPLPPLRQ